MRDRSRAVLALGLFLASCSSPERRADETSETPSETIAAPEPETAQDPLESPAPAPASTPPSPPPAAPAGPAAPPGPAKSPVERMIEDSMALRKERRYDEATAVLRKALLLSPPPDTAADIHMKIGEAHFRKAQDAQYGKLQGVAIEDELLQAAKVLEEGLTKYPDSPRAPELAYLRGSTFLMAGRYVESKSAYQSVVERYPSYRYVHTALLRVGICEASLGDAAAARATFEKVVAKHADKEADVKKARQYLYEIALVGQAAKPITADSWIRGLAANGLKSFEGDVRVLVFFATWCDRCSAENPHLRSLMEELGAKGVVFLGIANPDDPKNTVAVEVYLEREKIPYLDVGLDRSLASSYAYRVGALPAAVVIDRKGIVRWRGHPAFLPKGLVEGLIAEEVKPSP